MRTLLLVCTLVILGLASLAMAHDEPPFDVSMDLGEEHQVTHDDAFPFKGLMTVNVTNSGTEPWGAFTFEIFDPTGMGQYTDVYFGTGDTNIYPMINGVTVANEDFVIDTTAAGYARLVIYFPSTPLNSGETMEFVVYTDNTASEHSFFGVKMWPTSLEVGAEPTSLSSVKALFE